MRIPIWRNIVMFQSIQESPLYPLANPRHIAMFGASNSLKAMGTSQLMSIKALGFEGPLYPVHPTEDGSAGPQGLPQRARLA